MARNVARRNGNFRNNGGLGKFFLTFIAFVLGYMTASMYDLNQVTSWFNSEVLARHESQTTVKTAANRATLPKPKFEFYTLLANGQVTQPAAIAKVPPPVTTTAIASRLPSVPQPSVATKTMPLPVNLAVTQKLPAPFGANVPGAKSAQMAQVISNAYLIQIASFKNIREAERMKAMLAMKGFNVTISSTVQQQVSWYRVIIGPFGSRIDAQKAQQAFARSEHIIGMIRKMDA